MHFSHTRIITKHSIESNYFLNTWNKANNFSDMCKHSAFRSPYWKFVWLSTFELATFLFDFFRQYAHSTHVTSYNKPSSGLFVWSWHLKIESLKINDDCRFWRCLVSCVFRVFMTKRLRWCFMNKKSTLLWFKPENCVCVVSKWPLVDCCN